MSNYTVEELHQKKFYLPDLRKRILARLADLTSKISNDEDFPHGKQDVDTLIKIDDSIMECLNNWYY